MRHSLITSRRAALADTRRMGRPAEVAERGDPSKAGVLPRARRGQSLFFFCPDVTDAPTIKRVQQFIDHGYGVTVFGFRRGRYNMGYEPAWPHVPLGRTSDGRYWHRLRALLGALPTIFRHRRKLKSASVFYARNVDQLVLATLARMLAFSRAPLVYEVLDIPQILVRRGPVPALLRGIERLCLQRTRVLVLSSPGFHRGYFAPVQKYRGAWFLMENKLHPSIVDTAPRPPPVPVRPARRPNPPWVVGYFGLIRGERTFDLMTRLADRLKDRVVFRFGGVLTTIDRDRFAAALRQRPNMVYDGPYVPQQDLERIYRDVDFAWALDLEHADHNSRWLLPCRFYEAGYFGVPCLAVHGFEVGNLLERHRIGWTFDAPLEEALVRFFEGLSSATYEHIRGRLRAMPTGTFVAGDDDIARLSQMLD
jgi:succinoglycan biosynthesis protein ExoL